MPGRSASRRQHKSLTRLQLLKPPTRDTESAHRLLGWRREANRRAGALDAPAVWALANDPGIRAVAAALDSKGELQADLNRVCAEAVAREAGGSLVRGSRPLADRGRLQKAKPT